MLAQSGSFWAMSWKALSYASPYGLFGGCPEMYGCGAATDPFRKSGYVPPYTSRPELPMTWTFGAMPYWPSASDTRVRSPAPRPLMITPLTEPSVGIFVTYGATFGSFCGTGIGRVLDAPAWAWRAPWGFS